MVRTFASLMLCWGAIALMTSARAADGAAKVQIDTLEVIESTLGRRQLRFVLAWAELHQGELLENWRLTRVGETLQQIEPLQ